MDLSSGWRWLAVAAAVLGFSAVLLGATGSHAVKLENAAAEGSWAIALQIHYFHAAALLALAALSAAVPTRRLLWIPGLLLALGTVGFSGSLYLKAVQFSLLPGWVTPAGGMVLLVAWLCLILILIRK
jgi:uncharacterized membrane protein YgdD (TMEM256/DUF423 family)